MSVILTAARRLGRRAGQQTQPVTDCPYPTGPDATGPQRAAARAWVSEWLKWSPPSRVEIDFTDDEETAAAP